jgi:hypothetical protein
VPRRPPLQPGDKIVVEISHAEARHNPHPLSMMAKMAVIELDDK